MDIKRIGNYLNLIFNKKKLFNVYINKEMKILIELMLN